MAPFSWSNFLADQRTSLPILSAPLTDKTTIVVGANITLSFEGDYPLMPHIMPSNAKGLRFAAALKLAGMGPGKMILTVREDQVEKGKKAIELIKQSTGCSTVETWPLDLSSYASISAFVDRFSKEGGGKLDYLFLNAGVSTKVFTYSTEGWESTLQTHLGSALFAILLTPFLSAAQKDPTLHSPRIIITSSDVHYFLDRLKEADSEHILNEMNDPEKADMGSRYYASKLMNIFFTRAYANRLMASSPISICAVNPGFCKTGLFQPALTPFELITNKTLDASIARTPEMGSRTLIHAALNGLPKEEIHGKFLSSCRIVEESDYVLSLEGRRVQDRLWNETLDILRMAHSGVQPILNRYFLQTL